MRLGTKAACTAAIIGSGVLLGGAAPASGSGTVMDCSETQMELIEDWVREECGAWGGTVEVICHSNGITFEYEEGEEPECHTTVAN